MLVLSPKFKDFVTTITQRDYLEGTTAAGKTTVGIFKFMLMVARAEEKYHIIAGDDTGTVEKNVINSDNGLLEQFNGLVEYNGKGDKNIKIPHIRYETAKGVKIIYICGYDNKKRWKKVLGGQVGCAYIDEVNIADMEFMRELTHRCTYMMTTSNPDNPDLPVYKEFINRSRPLAKYIKDYPPELLAELTEPKGEGWVHWYFTFDDNAALTEKDKRRKIESVVPGTKMYKNKILGLRGKATGLVFPNFERKRNIVTADWVKKQIAAEGIRFRYFSAGLDTAYSQKSPDTIAMIFQGITEDRRLIVLDERIYKNQSLETPLAPSDTVVNFIDFLERNRKEWGFAKNTFIDSADQATITEAGKYKRLNGCIYNFLGAHKKMGIIDRIKMQLGWIQQGKYLVVDNCKEHVAELERYSWLEDKDNTPEDGNDHTINASQYGWIPYKGAIGYEEDERK